MPFLLLLLPFLFLGIFLYGCRLGHRYVGPFLIFLFLLPFRILGGAFGLLSGRRNR